VKFSDEKINAYADNELHGQEKNDFEKALQSDPKLQFALNNTYTLKKQILNTYKTAHTTNEIKAHPLKNMQLATYAIILLLTFSSGWISSDLVHAPGTTTQQTNAHPDNTQAITDKSGKYIIHVDKHDDNKFRKTLDQIEILLTQEKSKSEPVELEIIANAGGLDLFRVGLTPYTNQIQQIIANHPNVKFIACANAIERLLGQGKKPNLISAVQHGKITAIDQVIKRVNDGWTYIKI